MLNLNRPTVRITLTCEIPMEEMPSVPRGSQFTAFAMPECDNLFIRLDDGTVIDIMDHEYIADDEIFDAVVGTMPAA